MKKGRGKEERSRSERWGGGDGSKLAGDGEVRLVSDQDSDSFSNRGEGKVGKVRDEGREERKGEERRGGEGRGGEGRARKKGKEEREKEERKGGRP